jgi:hypothetical protein
MFHAHSFTNNTAIASALVAARAFTLKTTTIKG